MSRAFTREIDDAEAFRLPDRPVSAAANLVTPPGAALIAAEIARLEGELTSVGAEERAAVRRDLRYWSQRQASMQVTPPAGNPAVVGFGVGVRIRRGKAASEIRIVGEDEADPKQNLVAWTSPLAVALDGAEVGETVELMAGGRVEQVEVLAILA